VSTVSLATKIYTGRKVYEMFIMQPCNHQIMFRYILAGCKVNQSLNNQLRFAMFCGQHKLEQNMTISLVFLRQIWAAKICFPSLCNWIWLCYGGSFPDELTADVHLIAVVFITV